MASSTIERIASGTVTFIDSTIFIYHFSGVSRDCMEFLERCERGEIKGSTSTLVLAEVLHRLMMIEAVASGALQPGNLARKIRDKPELIKGLKSYQKQVEQIPLMGIDILPVDLKVSLRSREFRSRYGLMTNDSLVAASAAEAGINCLASADKDFSRVSAFDLFSPADLG